MKSEYIISRQGKEFVLYQGLLDEAHQRGLKRITTKLLQVPNPDNGNTAICWAEVEVEAGVFSGIGDANPQNVGKMIVPHLIRMAETRAKARALRDAVNVGQTSLEELGDSEGEGAPDQPRRQFSRPLSPEGVAEAERSRERVEAQIAAVDGPATNGRAKPDLAIVGAAQQRKTEGDTASLKAQCKRRLNDVANAQQRLIGEVVSEAMADCGLQDANNDEGRQRLIAWAEHKLASVPAGVMEV